jgi:hypothetical protein
VIHTNDSAAPGPLMRRHCGQEPLARACRLITPTAFMVAMMLSSGAKRARMRGPGGSAGRRRLRVAGKMNSCLARSDSEGRGMYLNDDDQDDDDEFRFDQMIKLAQECHKNQGWVPYHSCSTPSSAHVTNSMPVELQDASFTHSAWPVKERIWRISASKYTTTLPFIRPTADMSARPPLMLTHDTPTLLRCEAKHQKKKKSPSSLRAELHY